MQQAKIKYAVITGASSGIGLATAKELARRGINLHLIARRKSRLVLAKAKIKAKYDVDVLVHTCDVTKYSQLKETFRNISEYSTIDYLVCNAGRMICGRIEDNSITELNGALQANYGGVLNTYKAAVPLMKLQGEGQIGLVSSVAGYVGAIGYGGYAPSKFAISGLAECIRMEVSDYGIGTTIIYPPDTNTPFLKWEREHTLPECLALSKAAKVLSAKKVAHVLVEGMMAQKFEVFCNLESKSIRLLRVMWPSLYFRIIDSIVAKDRLARGVQ